MVHMECSTARLPPPPSGVLGHTAQRGEGPVVRVNSGKLCKVNTWELVGSSEAHLAGGAIQPQREQKTCMLLEYRL